MTKTVKASSLVEVITALVIISMVFGLAIVIYLNVQKGGLHYRKLTYTIMMDAACVEIMEAPTIANNAYEYGDVVVSVQSMPHATDPMLRIIRFEVRDDAGKLLDEKQVLKYAPHQP